MSPERVDTTGAPARGLVGVAILAFALVGLLPPPPAAGDEAGAGVAVIIETTGPRPYVARAAVGQPVRFVNRAVRLIHLRLLGDPDEHTLSRADVRTGDAFVAVFQTPGYHAYVVTFGGGRAPDKYGWIRVEAAPAAPAAGGKN